MNTLIRNGKVVTATQTIAADVLIEGELIKEVRAAIPANSAAKVIDAAGMYVLPGGIDGQSAIRKRVGSYIHDAHDQRAPPQLNHARNDVPLKNCPHMTVILSLKKFPVNLYL